MDRSEARREVISFLKTLQSAEASPDALGERDRLVGTALADSLDLLNMITFLEERYRIDFRSASIDPDEFDTLGGILDMIERHGNP